MDCKVKVNFINKKNKKQQIFLYYFSYGNSIMNVDVFEHMLDILKLYVMLVLMVQVQNFFLLRMTKLLNYGIQKLVGFLIKQLSLTFLIY
jgi:hypothetical protein